MDQIIELERIDLATVKPNKALAHVVKQPPKLLVVVGADELTGRSTTSPLAGHRFVVPTNAHTADGSAAGRVAKDPHQAAQEADPTRIASPTTVSIDRKHAPQTLSRFALLLCQVEAVVGGVAVDRGGGRQWC